MTHEPVVRWKPTRAGIRNIWEYDEQEFAFADGRMILRGPNGSGKSNALALVFPFLFDGTMSAAAMDPFAGGRSMKSLLLGVVRDDARSGFRHDQRLGYVWLEFARAGPGGDEHLTVGCGARPRPDGDARSWFFLTDRRVGIDLDLAPDNTPLTRGRLIEVLGAESVCDGAEQHRQVVARDLLGIDPDQLGKLNGLIRALRRPQLAGKLNVDELSAVLSSGLPAVASSTLDDIAASLDDLERVQQELTAVRDALATVETFLPAYRTYLGGEARLRAERVLHLDGRLDTERQDLARHERHHRELTDHDTALRARRRESESEEARAEAEREALKDSERFRGAVELQQEVEHAASLESAAKEAGERRDEAVGEADKRELLASGAEQEARSALVEAERGLQDTLDRADRVRALWSLDPDRHEDAAQLRAAVDVMVRERRDAIRAMRKAIRDVDAAAVAHRGAEETRSKADEAVDRLATDVGTARDELELLRAELADGVARWVATVPGLGADASDEISVLIERATDGESVALDDWYRLATEAYRDALRDEHGMLRTTLEASEAQREIAQSERDAVAAEEDPGPAAPVWRTSDRSGRAGAPLWACCDFAAGAGLSTGDRAGIEAALDAAGLLDAWLTTAGGDDDGIDAWLRPVSDAVDPDDQPTLASVLTPVVPEGSGLSAARVDAVLRSIRLGQVGIAVQTDGRFALGPLVGRAAKPSAEFIGATARAERRARRLAELDIVLADLDAELLRLADEQSRVGDLMTAWEHAARSAPDARSLTGAAVRLRVVESRHRDAVEYAREAASAEAEAAAAVSAAAAERDALSERLAVPATDEALEAFARKVEEFGTTGRDAAQQRTEAIERAGRATQEWDEATAARARAAKRVGDAETADRVATAKRQRVDTLRRRLGDDAGSVFDEVQALDDLIVEMTALVRSLGTEIEANQAAVGAATGAIEAGRERIIEADGRLRGAEARLPVLRGREVLTLVGLPTDDVPLEPVAFAGWVVGGLGEAPAGPDHDQAKRGVDRAQKQLLDELHQGYAPSIVHDDDVILVEVTSDDRSVFGLADLRDRLERQIATMEQHLTDSDREIFERHLLNRVSHELRRLLGEADEFVSGVNGALSRTKTASGLQVELKWVPAGDDPETKRALDLLRRDTDQMGDDDRAALRRFFDLAIKRQRAEDPDAGYRANLEHVVDYRQWHRFQPYLVGPDGRARLTRERFRGLSGGEQAVALHLPLFAAAAAHYDRADATAPRLVALDEAFAGIDEAMRGELLGLTVAFDLDVLLTGHELWGAYAEVPAIAVHDLLRRPPLEGVSVLTLRWDGHDLSEERVDAHRVVEPPDLPTDGLFAGDLDPA